MCVAFQDFSQLERDYGPKECNVIKGIVGNLLSSQVVGDSAKFIAERCGKVVQKRQGLSINRNDTGTNYNTQLDDLIPAGKIANLSQGFFVGTVADNYDQQIKRKVFHGELVVDTEQLKAEEAAYLPIPEISSFRDEQGKDNMQKIISENYKRIKAEAQQIMHDELTRLNKET